MQMRYGRRKPKREGVRRRESKKGTETETETQLELQQ